MSQSDLFDNSRISQLREKHRNTPFYDLPFILQLDRLPKRADEKKLLEQAYSNNDEDKRRKWLGDLTAKSHTQAIGAWFEMMLYVWLSRIGDTVVEPEILEQTPDFLLFPEAQRIVVEAKGYLIDSKTRKRMLWRDAFFNIVRKIQLPYAVSVNRSRVVGPPVEEKLISEMSIWLSAETDKPYVYEDEQGNTVVFHSEYKRDQPPVGLAWSGGAFVIDPNELKPSLKKKANANRGIRDLGYPYIIAIFIEDFMYSAEEVQRAWFGEQVFTVDAGKKAVTAVEREYSGLHFFRDQIQHRSVSGTLVFKLGAPDGFEGRFIEGWYIENPFANSYVDHYLFPVRSKYIVKSHQMGWVND